ALAKEIMPDRLIYLTTFTDKQQIILKLSETNTNIFISEGMMIDLNETVCNRIDFDQNSPLIFEDIRKETCLDDLRKALFEANINSYLGVPIMLANGEAFGTLCAVHQDARKVNEKSIKMIQRIAKMFSYYLNLERIAYRDSLTGIYNRQFLYKYFNDFSANGGTLFFLDLDGFKKINDIHGHDTGDLVLKEVAVRLESFVKQLNGFAVRLGGDEFVINIVDISCKEEISNQAESILFRLSSLDTQLEEFHLSASIGIVPYPPGENKNLKSLLKNADSALYHAKANGKNTYQFFG
ncbi:MAG: sensor domain-containing diguanylate cyclase, partial [Bacillota bacterium]|nr:sensor domain-containing diguanylate cyclase [Bacillota bacterium]